MAGAVDRQRGGGRWTPPGDPYPECARPGGGIERHRREGTRYCAACRAHNTRRSRVYRTRRALVGPLKVSSLGSQRRIRALMRLGWNQGALEDRWGLSRKTLSQVLLRKEITREKAGVIERGYREIVAWGLAGPDRRIRLWAERRGWPGPTDWDDIDRDRDVTASLVVDSDHAEAVRMNREIDKMLAKRRKRRTTAGQRAAARARREGAAA